MDAGRKIQLHRRSVNTIEHNGSLLNYGWELRLERDGEHSQKAAESLHPMAVGIQRMSWPGMPPMKLGSNGWRTTHQKLKFRGRGVHHG